MYFQDIIFKTGDKVIAKSRHQNDINGIIIGVDTEGTHNTYKVRSNRSGDTRWCHPKDLKLISE